MEEDKVNNVIVIYFTSAKLSVFLFYAVKSRVEVVRTNLELVTWFKVNKESRSN